MAGPVRPMRWVSFKLHVQDRHADVGGAVDMVGAPEFPELVALVKRDDTHNSGEDTKCNINGQLIVRWKGNRFGGAGC